MKYIEYIRRKVISKEKNKVIFFVIFLQIFLTTSCSKIVDVDPPSTSITGGSVYSYDATATAVMTGLYTNISGTTKVSSNKFRFLSWLTGMSSDELTLWSGVSDNRGVLYHTNKLASNSSVSIGGELWTSIYPYIYTCNSVIEGATLSTTLTPGVKNQLMGEARFMRALFYFYLVNIFGDVPLITGTDYKVSANISRTPVSSVYEQIVKDLNDAISLLNENYLDATLLKTSAERLRPNRSAAIALLARVYLYTGNFAGAEEKSSLLINNPAYSLPVLNSVFLRSSSEAIWQLQPVRAGYNTEEAQLFILPVSGPTTGFTENPVYISKNLLNSFETGDIRKTAWIDSVITAAKDTFYYPHKYKVKALNAPVTEFAMILRLAEQYLIRAESRLRQDKLDLAKADLNMIRSRAGLPPFTLTSKDAIFDAIIHEKRVELFTEWGHRWLDLKRTHTIDKVMTALAPSKGTTWNTLSQLYPIPFREIQVSTVLTQNPGY